MASAVIGLYLDGIAATNPSSSCRLSGLVLRIRLAVPALVHR